MFHVCVCVSLSSFTDRAIVQIMVVVVVMVHQTDVIVAVLHHVVAVVVGGAGAGIYVRRVHVYLTMAKCALIRKWGNENE